MKASTYLCFLVCRIEFHFKQRIVVVTDDYEIVISSHFSTNVFDSNCSALNLRDLMKIKFFSLCLSSAVVAGGNGFV